MTREKELRVSANSRTNNVRVVDRAEIPRTPLTPGGRRTWLMSAVIGLVLAVAVALGLDYMNDTIKTPEDVARRLKLPFLGLVPSVRGAKHPVLTSSHIPHDFGEAFRSLRTSLISRFPGEGTKIVVVTSAQPLEGKTTTAPATSSRTSLRSPRGPRSTTASSSCTRRTTTSTPSSIASRRPSSGTPGASAARRPLRWGTPSARCSNPSTSVMSRGTS